MTEIRGMSVILFYFTYFDRYDFKVVPTNPLGEGPASVTVEFSTESGNIKYLLRSNIHIMSCTHIFMHILDILV